MNFKSCSSDRGQINTLFTTRSQGDPGFLCRIAHILEFPVGRLPAPHPHPAVGIDEHRLWPEDLHAFFDPLFDLGNGLNPVDR